LQIFQISTYAPTSDSHDADIVHFEDALATAISHCGLEDILVMCMDANASIGCKNSDKCIDGAHRNIESLDLMGYRTSTRLVNVSELF
jgi:hypothetical protein